MCQTVMCQPRAPACDATRAHTLASTSRTGLTHWPHARAPHIAGITRTHITHAGLTRWYHTLASPHGARPHARRTRRSHHKHPPHTRSPQVLVAIVVGFFHINVLTEARLSIVRLSVRASV